MSKKIQLTQGKFAIVDDGDYEFLNQWKWYYDRGYAVRNGSIPKRRKVLMHRIVLERAGFKDFADSDHINRDKCDNRRTNLRPATHGQNQCNRDKQRNNTSGYIGVNRCRRTKKWRASIRVNGKLKQLGYFTDKEEARRVRDEAAKKHYGEFAILNKE
jgi:hypothetical protein